MISRGEYISVLIWTVYSSLWFTTLDVHIVLVLAVVVNGSDTVLHRNFQLVHFELQLLSSEVNALQLWLLLIQYCVQCKLYLGCRYICSFITGSDV
jgi:ABC-type sugar transport system permease subunit